LQLRLQSLKSINRRGPRKVHDDDALSFISLPDKIRRLHFTKQENILMRAACELQLSKHPRYDNVFPRQRPVLNARSSTSHSYAASLINRDTMWDSASAPSTPTTLPESFDLSRPRTSSTVSSNASILPFNPLACHPCGPSIAANSPLDLHRIITKTPDASGAKTRQYLDPKTRMMIRQCTASPEAFDEVITFGYLSDEYGHAPESHNKLSDQQLLDDLESGDDVSDEDDEDDDDDSTSDTDEGPWTPSSEHTMATNWDAPQSPRFAVQRLDSGRLRTQEREMTLRVTLTKPELRSAVDDTPTRPAKSARRESAHMNLRNDDPLALQELTFSDDVTGMFGAFAVTPTREEGKVKKLFKILQRASTAPGF
jgi:hypothetical protein